MRRYKTLRARKQWRASRGALDAREQQERRDYVDVIDRAAGQCEVVLKGTRCARPKMFGLHHVTKRSQGGRFKGPDTLMAVCLRHHDLADNAHPAQRTLIDGRWVNGRLMIVAEGKGRFRCWMETTPKRVTA